MNKKKLIEKIDKTTTDILINTRNISPEEYNELNGKDKKNYEPVYEGTKIVMQEEEGCPECGLGGGEMMEVEVPDENSKILYYMYVFEIDISGITTGNIFDIDFK